MSSFDAIVHGKHYSAPPLRGRERRMSPFVTSTVQALALRMRRVQRVIKELMAHVRVRLSVSVPRLHVFLSSSLLELPLSSFVHALALNLAYPLDRGRQHCVVFVGVDPMYRDLRQSTTTRDAVCEKYPMPPPYLASENVLLLDRTTVPSLTGDCICFSDSG